MRWAYQSCIQSMILGRSCGSDIFLIRKNKERKKKAYFDMNYASRKISGDFWSTPAEKVTDISNNWDIHHSTVRHTIHKWSWFESVASLLRTKCPATSQKKQRATAEGLKESIQQVNISLPRAAQRKSLKQPSLKTTHSYTAAWSSLFLLIITTVWWSNFGPVFLLNTAQI